MSGPKPPVVVCVGVVTLDALALVDRHPGPDERVVADRVAISGGGPAATAAVVMARQGVPVSFVGRVGTDPEGEQALALLAAEGVDVTGVLRDPATPTQSSVVLAAAGTATRCIATRGVPPLPPLAGRAAELVAGADWAHTDHLGFAPVAELVERLAAAGHPRPRLALDAGNEVPGLDGRLGLVDLYVPTAASLTARYGAAPDAPGAVPDCARRALAEGAGAVVATSGGDGSAAWWPDGGHAAAPAARGVEIVSTLGAGDVFHGALLAARCLGRDWPEALRHANATAALSCRALDGRSAVPDLAELSAFLSDAGAGDAGTGGG
ncbi:ribokinase [Streptomyces sp. 3MP-14]|uniref:Ribokinase n=1 Tax=Streptomyces mimosae TaxID=2586635 RepID=A0A5N6A7X7_9ACTN|nr:MULTISPECIES: PfkB family carbohydrate kinase [Streptomyces]KAB8163830.1 ribokinase [Streptomyces mimosae]KAB8175273.1 ribokinase [Streptomyces sp. 3MP-14]